MILPALVSGLDREGCSSERQLPCRFPFPRGASLFSAVTLRGRWVRGVVREREASSSTTPTAPPTTRAAFAHPLRAAFVLEPASRAPAAVKQPTTTTTTNNRPGPNKQTTGPGRETTGTRQRREQTAAKSSSGGKEAHAAAAKADNTNPAQQTPKAAQRRRASELGRDRHPTPDVYCTRRQEVIGPSPSSAPAAPSLGSPENRVGFWTAPQTILRVGRVAQVAVRRREANGTTPLSELRL